MLSALTGAISGARAVEVGQHQASGPVRLIRATAVAVVRAAARAFDQHHAIHAAGLRPRLATVAAWVDRGPRYSDRLRE